MLLHKKKNADCYAGVENETVMFEDFFHCKNFELN